MRVSESQGIDFLYFNISPSFFTSMNRIIWNFKSQLIEPEYNKNPKGAKGVRKDQE